MLYFNVTHQFNYIKGLVYWTVSTNVIRVTTLSVGIGVLNKIIVKHCPLKVLAGQAKQMTKIIKSVFSLIVLHVLLYSHLLRNSIFTKLLSIISGFTVEKGFFKITFNDLSNHFLVAALTSEAAAPIAEATTTTPAAKTVATAAEATTPSTAAET